MNKGILPIRWLQLSAQPYLTVARAAPLLADEPDVAVECDVVRALAAINNASGVAWNDVAIEAQLPLAPGATLRIELALAGHDATRGAALLLAYAAAVDSTHCRHAMVPLALRIAPVSHCL